MHPRNPFKLKPPIFQELASKYIEFRKYCYIGPRGKVCVDFKNEDAVRCLSETLLREYFDLCVHFPSYSLVPRVPQRINYILLIEDLLTFNKLDSDVIGIDIGTGASCIYPLLGAYLKKWTFYCTEVDESSILVAKSNVEKNGLDEKITIFRVLPHSIFQHLLGLVSTNFTFSICNPPFFDEEERKEKFNASNGRFTNILNGTNLRTSPNSSTSATHGELCTPGGEVEFVSMMIRESCEHKDRVRIFTTMLGKKSSIVPLEDLIKSLDDNAKYSVYNLEQGRTQRWVLAWSFYSSTVFPKYF